MNAFTTRATPPLMWLTFFMSVLALLFALEPVALRIYDWAKPPVTMTWQAEVLPDGRFAVRFSGFKYRDECELAEVRAFGRTASGGEERLSITRDGPGRNRRLGVGPFGPTLPWVLVPPPIGDPRIVAEFDCGARDVVVEVLRASR